MIRPLSPADIDRLRRRKGAAPRIDESAAQAAPEAGLIAFTRLRMRDYAPAPLHHLIAEHLERVERREIRRLILLIAPRHGKSELASKSYPAWSIGRHPERHFISCSASVDLARRWGGDVRDIVNSRAYQLAYGTRLERDRQAAGRWVTDRGGSYLAIGVGGSIFGWGADDILIDDPYGGVEDFESPVIREKVWRWFTSTIYNRLEPNGSIILINHRAHEDDLTARLIEKMQSGDSDADQWTIVKVPALCDAGGDPLGRSIGEAAWPERWPVKALAGIRSTMMGRDWSALYQQNPVPDEGIFFSPDRIGLRFDTRNVVSWTRAWDLGGTAKGDWTCGVMMGKTRENKVVIGDVKRTRSRWEEVENLILETARGDTHRVRAAIPVDPGQAGLAQKQEFVRLLAGFTVDFSPETGSKEVRARPFATQVNNFNCEMLSGSWNAGFRDELRSFPYGKFDDQVDACSRAFMVLMGSGRKSLAEINRALGGDDVEVSDAGGSGRLARQIAEAKRLASKSWRSTDGNPPDHLVGNEPRWWSDV